MIAEVRKIGEGAQQSAQSLGVPRLVDLKALAELWSVPLTWLQDQCRSRVIDNFHAFGSVAMYVVDLNDPALAAWLGRRRVGGTK